MKRSVQEIVELLVFGLIALLIGTGLLWLAGWIFDLVGVLFKFFAGLIWSLLRFIVPVAVVAAIVYALVRLLQGQRSAASATSDGASTASESRTTAPTTPAAPPPPQEAHGTSEPHASEVWAPPQPSPPANDESVENDAATVRPESEGYRTTGEVRDVDTSPDDLPAAGPVSPPDVDEHRGLTGETGTPDRTGFAGETDEAEGRHDEGGEEPSEDRRS